MLRLKQTPTDGGICDLSAWRQTQMHISSFIHIYFHRETSPWNQPENIWYIFFFSFFLLLSCSQAIFHLCRTGVGKWNLDQQTAATWSQPVCQIWSENRRPPLAESSCSALMSTKRKRKAPITRRRIVVYGTHSTRGDFCCTVKIKGTGVFQKAPFYPVNWQVCAFLNWVVKKCRVPPAQ